MRIFHPRTLVCCVVFAYLSTGAQAASLEDVARSKEWMRLLHYKPRLLGGVKSKVDGPDFFFSPNGKTDALEELKASAEAFGKNLEIGKLKQHPQCAFPERYRFVKRELGLAVKDVPCPKLDEFMKRFNARSATLVFSSAYPNNPGSMFGHTFLRINAETPASSDQKKLDLLDYGISFAAAVADDENMFAFVVLGLGGGYMGQFSMLPYYVKVNEYNNSESRDIWEYDLNLTKAETEKLLRHVWEIETNSWFDYFFIDENCALQLLILLEVAKPEWEGVSDFGLYVIPAETIKRLMNVPGAVTNIKYRPSLRKKMMQKFSLLDEAERGSFFGLINGEKSLSEVKSPELLESLSSYLYYIKQKKSGVLDETQSRKLKEILIRRSELGAATQKERGPSTETTVSSGNSRPDFGHHPYRLGTAGGVMDGGGKPGTGLQYYQELQFKFAYHDLMNNDVGYMRWSHVDFPSIVLRYAAKDRVFTVENFQALGLTSLFPMTFLEKSFSWGFTLNYWRPKDLDCAFCHVSHFQVGGGPTIELFDPRFIAYAFAMGNIDVGPALRKGFRFGPRAQAAVLMNPIDRFKLKLQGDLISDLAQSDRQKYFWDAIVEQSLSLSQSLEIRASHEWIFRGESIGTNYRDAKLTLNFYF